jgi:hypothetical protein
VELLEAALGAADPEAQLVDFGADYACLGRNEQFAAVVVEQHRAAVVRTSCHATALYADETGHTLWVAE